MESSDKASRHELAQAVLYQDIKDAQGKCLARIAYREKSTDYSVLRQIFEHRAYSLERLRLFPLIMRWLSAMSARGTRPLIIDCGANIGASAVWFGLGHPDASIVAIEPESNNFRLLEQNTHSFHCTALQGAIAASKKQVRLEDPGIGAWGFRMADAGVAEQASITTFTVPELLKTYCTADHLPFLIKIDIEGGESDLFSSSTQWIAQFPILIIELHDWLLPGKASSRSFLQAVAATGRDFINYGENIFSIDATAFQSLPSPSPGPSN